MEDWDSVSSYRHSVGVRKVFPDQIGTWLVFIDNKNTGFLLCPAKVRIFDYFTHLFIIHTENRYSKLLLSLNINAKYQIVMALI